MEVSSAGVYCAVQGEVDRNRSYVGAGVDLLLVQGAGLATTIFQGTPIDGVAQAVVAGCTHSDTVNFVGAGGSDGVVVRPPSREIAGYGRQSSGARITGLNLLIPKTAWQERERVPFHIGVGGAAANCAAVGGVATVVTATGSAASKHLDERGEIELEGMYFAWKASGHAPHKH